MSTLLLTFAVGAGIVAQAGGTATAAPNLDGKWLVVYAEEGGRRNNAWEQRLATMKGDTLTYEQDGKERTIRLKLGPNQTLEAAGAGEPSAKPLTGVYIAGQDYLCISIGPAPREGGNMGPSSGSFILILRRQLAGAAPKP
jgi:hypothetical protein